MATFPLEKISIVFATNRPSSIGFACVAALALTSPAFALDIVGPTDSVHFGQSVTVLPNGNIVVTDPDANGTAPAAGAVYLYSPSGALISTLSGSQADDHVGSTGIVVLANGNYVIRSAQWHNDTEGNAGAVTWGNAASGINGVVSANNSLVGTTAYDQVGSVVVALGNGNYVVGSASWHNANTGGTFAGAVTWGNGNGGTAGAVSATNSLVGTSSEDYVGDTDTAGLPTITVLDNGNYVVRSPFWDNGNVSDAGAVTWCDGNGGTAGPITSANSLVGTSVSDHLGSAGVTALRSGHYVVASPDWKGNGYWNGAATWGNGNGGTVGGVSAANSLVGTQGDYVGFGGVTALSNGNYVVSSPLWSNGAVSGVGAATWGNGGGGTTGAVSAANSLAGTTSWDSVGHVIALSNGNYVAVSPGWDNGAIVDAGAVTWGNGNGGTVGEISSANSLVGGTNDDRVGFMTRHALSNGNYVVQSPIWDNGNIKDAGAVTWGNGNGGTTGLVSTLNSLVGTSTEDRIGAYLTPLSNGNYVIVSPFWDNGGATDAGAATWASGSGSTAGSVSASNSLAGVGSYDMVGFCCGIAALSNGDYVVRSPQWSGFIGAATLGNGRSGTVGMVTPTNSLVGSTNFDQIGYVDSMTPEAGVTALRNGHYVVQSATWGGTGAVTLRRGSDHAGATVTPENSVRGLVSAGGSSMVWDYDATRDQLIVGRPAENMVTLFLADLLFRDGFD